MYGFLGYKCPCPSQIDLHIVEPIIITPRAYALAGLSDCFCLCVCLCVCLSVRDNERATRNTHTRTLNYYAIVRTRLEQVESLGMRLACEAASVV